MLSLIVLCCNKVDYSALLLESLLATEYRPLEFCLVDNGSTDETPQMLVEFAARAKIAGHGVKVLTFAENIGAIRGRNEAMQVADGRWFAFLDNDTIVRDRDWATRLIARLEAEDDLGIVSPKLVFPWEPYDIEFCGIEITEGGRPVYVNRGAPIDHPACNVYRDYPCLISACIVFRRRLYDELGGLDEVYSPVQFEDLDFCYRARAAGWRCAVDPSVEMYHWEHTTTAGTSTIPFELVTLRNGRTFKKRWDAELAADAILPNEAAQWLQIQRYNYGEVPNPPFRR